MDVENLRRLLDSMDARVYEFIYTGASLDEIREMIEHRDARRLQAMEGMKAYVLRMPDDELDDVEEEELDDVEEEETARAGRSAD